MRGAWITASVPLVATVGAFTALYTLRGSLAEGSLYFIVGILAVGAAALGSLVAVLAFDPGDYMRRAWALMGWCYGLLALNTLLFRSAGHVHPRPLTLVEAVASGTLIVLANVSSVLGNVRIARAWRVSGLDLRVPEGVRWGSILASLAVAIALVGGTTWEDLQALLDQQWGSGTSVVSDLGDIVSLALVAPILLTAFALRGGSLGWPWSLLALSSVGWLLYSAAAVLGPALGLDASAQRPFEASMRVLACAAQLAAGLLQATVLTESEQPLPLPLATQR